MKKLDIVIPLGAGSNNDNLELRYCLRSIEKNFKNLGNIYIVGYKPEWITNIIHIPCEDINKRNKDANIIRKVILACKQENLSETFIRMSDDQIFLKQLNEIPIIKGILLSKFLYQKRYNRWHSRAHNTMELFGENTYNFDTHTPQPIVKSEFIQLEDIYKNIYEEGGGYTINSLYFNHFKYDSKYFNIENKISVETDLDFNYIEEESKGKMYLGYNDSGFKDGLKKFLNINFNNKSIYEL